MTGNTVQIVSPADLERELDQARLAAPGDEAGLFGPASATWTVNREAAIFLGAGRALLLQLAHPWVAAAIEQYSDAVHNPVGRFHRTFSIMFAMVFGSLDESFAAARRLHRRHQTIAGTLFAAAGPFPAGSPYCANAVPALRWVLATLTESALIAYAVALPGLGDEEREAYYADARLLARLFGIPEAAMPGDWAGFSAYVAAMLDSDTLTVTPAARRLADALFERAFRHLPFGTAYKALTASLLPERLNQAYGLPYGVREAEATERLIRRIRGVYPHLPAWLRHVGPYQEATQRLAGRDGPALVTRMSNRAWMGRPRLAEEGSARALRS